MNLAATTIILAFGSAASSVGPFQTTSRGEGRGRKRDQTRTEMDRVGLFIVAELVLVILLVIILVIVIFLRFGSLCCCLGEMVERPQS